MRTYRILDSNGNVLAEQTHEDAIRPPLLSGHAAQLVAIDGERLHRKSQPVLGTDQPVPDDDHLETEDEFRARRDAIRAEREAVRAEQEAAEAREARKHERAAARAESKHAPTEPPAPDAA